MNRLKWSLLTAVFWLLIACAPAVAYQTQNVVVVVLCGVRSTEAVLDPTHQYIPHIWNDLKPQGVVNFNVQTFVAPTTPPGHYAILTGAWSGLTITGSISSGFRVDDPTIYEYIRKSFGLPLEKVYALTGGSNMLTNTNYSLHPLFGKNYKASLLHRNDRPKDDAVTYQQISETMDTYQPSFLFVTLKAADLYAHENNWNGYVNAIAVQDQIIYDLWNKIESDPYYAGKTTLFVLGDHGRHDDEHGGYTDHGGAYLDDGSRNVPFLALGPDFKKNVTFNFPRKLIDMVPTIGKLLGIETPFAHGRIMWELFKDTIPPATDNVDDTHPSISMYNNKMHLVYQRTSKTIRGGSETVYYHNDSLAGGQKSTPLKLSETHILSVQPVVTSSSSGLHMLYTGWLPTDGSYVNHMDWQNVYYKKSTDSGNTR